MNNSDKLKIFEIFQKDLPDPKIELVFKNHYTLLVAVLLSAQTTDKKVNQATLPLFEKVDSAKKMLHLGEDELKEYIKTIGLFNSKARNIIALSQKLYDDHDGNVPSDFDYLITLPGIGRKSANVILNAAFGMDTIGVDTHVFRVANRIGLVKSKNVDKTESQLVDLLPKKWLRKANQWLVLHGRYICKARKPLCSDCKIKDFCDYYHSQDSTT